MTRKYFRPDDYLKGEGKIIREETPIADVWYEISIDEGFMIAREFGKEIPNPKHINYARFTVISGEKYFSRGEKVILLLKNDREAKCTIRSIDINSGTCDIFINNPEEVFK